jgi:hypothetical protein
MQSGRSLPAFRWKVLPLQVRIVAVGCLLGFTLKIEAERSSETSVNYETTWGKVPEDSNLRRKNLKPCKSIKIHMTFKYYIPKVLFVVPLYE